MSPTFFHDDFDHHQRSIRNMREINGPRPSPLTINKDSHVIQKLSSSSNSLLLAHNKQQQQQQQQKQPVIIYAHSPKVIHTQPRDFMALVQKLTGLSGSADRDSAPTTQAQETNEQTNIKKPKQKTSSDDHENHSSLVLTHEQKRLGGGGDYGVNSSSISPITKAPTNPYLADMPLFTPTSTDNFFCSPRPTFRFPETMFASPNTGNPISPSLIEFMKGLPEC